MPPSPPSYDGRGLVNLSAELEARLSGSAPSPRLAKDLAASIPEAATYVLVVFDGLGAGQVDDRATPALAAARAGTLDAPFPTTTTVGLSTLASGLPPRGSGWLGHLVWLPGHGVVNSLKWVTVAGTRVDHDTSSLLPRPNLWERLCEAGLEAVTVQPADFARTPLTAALYRGCRFDGVSTVEEAVEATVVLARQPGRLILTYLNQVDFAAHVWGQGSHGYREALRVVDRAWADLVSRLPEGAVAVGTADHGHADYAETAKRIIRSPVSDGLTFYGDPRAVLVKGDIERIRRFAGETGGDVLPMPEAAELWGPPPEHPEFPERAPDAVVLARPGSVILPKGFDKRLVGYHGGLEPAEVEVPLLVARAFS